jgi:hypothetical protein
MSLQDILNNTEHKIIFLRAILLGMKYSEGDNPNFYKNNIKNELDKLLNENKSNDKKDIVLIKILEKYKKNIIELENKRNYLITYIKNLKPSHNYVKINLLNNNLDLINKEIEKYNLIIKRHNKIDTNGHIVKDLENTLSNLSNLII